MKQWAPMDVEDALELLTPKFTHPAVRRSVQSYTCGVNCTLVYTNVNNTHTLAYTIDNGTNVHSQTRIHN